MGAHSTDTASNHTTNVESNRILAAIRPSFIVKDLQTSIAYYRERLGFQLDFQGPDEGPFWAGVSRDGIGIMLKAVASDVPPIPTTRDTHGRRRTPSSTARTPMRSSTSSAGAVRRSSRRCRS